MPSRIDFILDKPKTSIKKRINDSADVSKCIKEINSLIKVGYDCDMMYNASTNAYDIICSSQEKKDYVSFNLSLPDIVDLKAEKTNEANSEELLKFFKDIVAPVTKAREVNKKTMSVMLRQVLRNETKE